MSTLWLNVEEKLFSDVDDDVAQAYGMDMPDDDDQDIDDEDEDDEAFDDIDEDDDVEEDEE